MVSFAILFSFYCSNFYLFLGDQYFLGFFLCVSLILSRLGLGGYLVFFCLLFVRVEFGVLRMARFYRNNPTLLHLHFPEWQDPKRKMHRVTASVIEGAQNPGVQAVV